MKQTLTFLVLAGIIFAGSSCQKNNDVDDSPSCPVENSLPVRVDYTDAYGFSATQEWTYDALNRVTQITNHDSIFTLNIVYKGLDTAIFTNQNRNGGSTLMRRIFNGFGEHLETFQISFKPNRDTSFTVTTRYIFNLLHQQTSIHQEIFSYTNGRATGNPPDSALLYWVEGNLIKEVGSQYYYNINYEYYPNTNGQFELNFLSGAQLYNVVTKPLLSKN